MIPARAALFDMDGVLVFSEEAWFEVYNRTLFHFDHPPIPREAFDAIYGNGTEADRDAYMPERTIEEINEVYGLFFEEELHRVHRNEEAPAVLEELRRRGIATAVATNTQHRLARTVLSVTGLLPYVDVVACADEAGAGKPDPAVLHLASSRLGVPLTEAVFTGDSRYDAEASRRAGVPFFGFRLDAERRIEGLCELLALPELAAAPPGLPRL